MTKLFLAALFVVLSVYGLNHYLNVTKEELYQQAALRCAMNPEHLNCDQFNTAAGMETP
jgi:hypothetical protein